MPSLSLSRKVAAPGAVAHGCAYSAPWRVVVAVLTVVVGIGIACVSALLVWTEDPTLTRGPVFVLFGILVLLPALVVRAIRHLSAASVQVDELTMAITRRGLRLEVPGTAIEEVVPWRVPLPGPGFSLRMRSGRELRYGLETAELSQLLQALAERADVAAARRTTRHPSVIYAAARERLCPRGWIHAIGKFGLFSLLPAVVLLYEHATGQTSPGGVWPYAMAFLGGWSAAAIYLVLYAGIWRLLAEAASLAAAWLTPAYTVTVRRVAEAICRAAYYGGVSLILLVRFLP